MLLSKAVSSMHWGQLKVNCSMVVEGPGSIPGPHKESLLFACSPHVSIGLLWVLWVPLPPKNASGETQNLVKRGFSG